MGPFGSHAIGVWRVEEDKLVRLEPSEVGLEKLLKPWIESDPSFTGMRLLVIGLEVSTDNGSIDLLAIDEDGVIHVIELKRDKAPRTVIEQVIDYHTWVETVSRDKIISIFADYRQDVSLEDAFYERFGRSLPDAVSETPVLTILATSILPTTARKIQSLRSRGYSINVITFQCVQDRGITYLVPARQAAPDVEPYARLRIAQDRAASLHQSRLGELNRLAEGLRRLLETHRRPTAAVVQSRPVTYRPGVDPDILCFWLTFVQRFVWDFVPSSFLFLLYRHWHRTEAAMGVQRDPHVTGNFGRLLRVAVTASGGWEYDRIRRNRLMDADEKLTKLLPDWKMPKPDQSVIGYVRTGTLRKRSEHA